ncbi:MAG: peptidoglycan binding protein CsiV, partial [Congregibacter sp.]|nr:peptidoglycan binding protein CsiV [Congregibacter sp.]
AEQWDPLPILKYPSRYRFLLDPTVADRRLKESLSYASSIDKQGLQTLRVPAPIEEVLDHSRPDAITTPLADLDLLLPGEDEEPAVAQQNLQQASDTPVIALPYELLADDKLDFRAQARSLRRQGHQVVFHGTWWAQLNDAEQTPALIIDRSGDMDSLDWPALQGSLQIYRSRYLHIVLDLWLNTLGDYLPAGWQIRTPPLGPASLKAETLSGRSMYPWSSREINAATALTPGQDASEPVVSSPNYPWHHAIVHRQSRRMRSGEIHYLDHPVVGVIVRITPMSDTDLPLLAPQERAFRERHSLPVDVLPSDQNTDRILP